MDQVEKELHRELGELVEKEHIQCCVLGCTHYSLVSDSIRRMFPQLTLVDPAWEMARMLKEYLQKNDLFTDRTEEGRVSIYTTGDVEEYSLRAKQAGLQRVEQVKAYPALKI